MAGRYENSPPTFTTVCGKPLHNHAAGRGAVPEQLVDGSPMEPNWGPMEPKWNPMELEWMPMEPKWSRMEPKGCPMAPNWAPMGHICVSCVPHWVSASSTHGDCGTPRLQAPNLRETATARRVDTCTTTLSIFLMQFDRRQEIKSPIECAGKKAPSRPLDELSQHRGVTLQLLPLSAECLSRSDCQSTCLVSGPMR